MEEEKGDHSLRESECVAADDPHDINQSRDFMFLLTDASQNLMRSKHKGRRKYVFVKSQRLNDLPLKSSSSTPSVSPIRDESDQQNSNGNGLRTDN